MTSYLRMNSLSLIWMLQHILITIGAICMNNTSLIDLNEISTNIINNKFQNTNMAMGNGENYNNYITMHPSDSSTYGSIIWPLNGKFSLFTAIIGLSLSNTNCINKYGSDSNHDGVIYKFYIDNTLKYTSSQIQYALDFDNISINITNGINLKVEIYKLNSSICDIAVIANPILHCKSNINIHSTIFVTKTSVHISTTNSNTSSKSTNIQILILTWSIVFLAICICVIFVYRSRHNKRRKSYNQTIKNSSPLAIQSKEQENEMQPLGANKSEIQYIHAAMASDTVVVHQQMDTMADMDVMIENNNENNNIENKNDEQEKLVLQDYDTGNSEVVDLNHTQNETVVMKHSVMETITNIDVGSLPNFDDEIDMEEFKENDDGELKLENYNTGTNSDIVNMQHSTQNTTVINHSSMNTLADIDTDMLPKFDDEDVK